MEFDIVLSIYFQNWLNRLNAKKLDSLKENINITDNSYPMVSLSALLPIRPT